MVEVMLDIRDFPEIIDVLNNIINNRGVAEIKKEVNKQGDESLVIVEMFRTMKYKNKI